MIWIFKKLNFIKRTRCDLTTITYSIVLYYKSYTGRLSLLQFTTHRNHKRTTVITVAVVCLHYCEYLEHMEFDRIKTNEIILCVYVSERVCLCTYFNMYNSRIYYGLGQFAGGYDTTAVGCIICIYSIGCKRVRNSSQLFIGGVLDRKIMTQIRWPRLIFFHMKYTSNYKIVKWTYDISQENNTSTFEWSYPTFPACSGDKRRLLCPNGSTAVFPTRENNHIIVIVSSSVN